ncbi:MAG: hypothetical protein AAFP78_13640, partial [Pseudomonadota bacterium]
GEMDHLQAEIAHALRQAGESRGRRRAPRFGVRTEGGTFPVQQLWEGGFSVKVEDAPRLRGFVDLMVGDERLARCLIVLAEEEENGIIRYEYKRRTEEATAPSPDYAPDPEAPVALLT